MRLDEKRKLAAEKAFANVIAWAILRGIGIGQSYEAKFSNVELNDKDVGSWRFVIERIA